MRSLTALILLFCAACAGGDPPKPAPHRAGTVTVTVRRGETPPPLRLTVGTVLQVTAEPSPRQPWTPLTSTDALILDCVSRSGPQGTITATCTAKRPGRATIATITAPFPGDPRGPAQFRWARHVEVVRPA
ncbi:hypothetical protein DZF91_32975 [Actinomadura logoneensis]|uniref:Proteinase inhibitor I42 chagasin domain-containing protein n=1 Tax=Actinomadura logoneensis TaxID=2293572 RepID=A0A372JBX5_9ACTN|nr:hypothetical protein [Actinomadura logoneensis]RFU37419.1 hypothetical protein DZF91_32975 [Actinomadura logoneensis]